MKAYNIFFIALLVILLSATAVSAYTWTDVCNKINLTAAECDDWLSDFRVKTKDVADDRINLFKDTKLIDWMNVSGYRNDTYFNITNNISNNVSIVYNYTFGNWLDINNFTKDFYNRTELNDILIGFAKSSDITNGLAAYTPTAGLVTYALKTDMAPAITAEINAQLADTGTIGSKINTIQDLSLLWTIAICALIIALLALIVMAYMLFA